MHILKMSCDISGASYAIFWTVVNDRLAVGGYHITDEHR